MSALTRFARLGMVALVLGLTAPAGAQTTAETAPVLSPVDQTNFSPNGLRPGVMAPNQPSSSSVRPPEAPVTEPVAAVGVDPDMGVTRMTTGAEIDGATTPADPAPGVVPQPADQLGAVLRRDPPTQQSAGSLLKDVLLGNGRDRGNLGATDNAAAPMAATPETTLGAHNDAAVWSAVRNGNAPMQTQVRGPATAQLIQDGGMPWLQLRHGPLPFWGGILLLGMMGVLALFYLIRGRIRLDGEKAGVTIQRFAFIERFGHWLMAGSFVLLAITGLTLLFGRLWLIPLIGHEAFSPIARGGKWVHNNVSWAFMLGILLVLVMWAGRNIPRRIDLQWLAKGGGIFTKNVHPHAGKFNAGQKILFWAVVLFGISISLSGLSLLFPFQLNFFGHTFGFVNSIFGTHLPAEMTPHHEMQLAQTWHTIIAFVYIAMVLAHIYIGSIGMEGAFDAVGSGQVDMQWAREHHDLWFEVVTGRDSGNDTPGPDPETLHARLEKGETP